MWRYLPIDKLCFTFQLETTKKESLELTDKYREMEREVQVIRQRCNEQSDQLVKKSGEFQLLNISYIHSMVSL